jgi:hypothetical protein
MRVYDENVPSMKHAMDLWEKIFGIEEMHEFLENDGISVWVKDTQTRVISKEIHKKIFKGIELKRRNKFTNVVRPFIRGVVVTLHPFRAMPGLFEMMLTNVYAIHWRKLITEEYMDEKVGYAKAIQNNWAVTHLMKVFKDDPPIVQMLSGFVDRLKEKSTTLSDAPPRRESSIYKS